MIVENMFILGLPVNYVFGMTFCSPSEMEEVAQFIKRRGRVSIEDIAAQR